MTESVFFDVSRDITKLYPLINNEINHVDKTQKIFEIDKTMFENLRNHDTSKLYTSNHTLTWLT